MSKGIIKSWQSSTMPRYRKISLISEEQRTIFNQVVSLLKPYSNRLDTRISTPEQYELWTKHNFRSLSMNPKNKRGILFAGALIMKKHIGLYVYPIHINHDLIATIDEIIRPFWKGNSAFHFHKPLTDLITVKLTQLLDEGWGYYRQKQWIF
jgi:hypothetical protein